MKVVSIIGAGQLGSRHLQALALHDHPLTIYIVDPIDQSLALSKERFLEVDKYKNKSLHFIQSIAELPSTLDFVVIATNSKQRLEVLKELLFYSKVRYLLLEKFLFPKCIEYEEAKKLINDNKVKAYVNCARRMWSDYQELHKMFKYDSNIKLIVDGSNWNLASNSIHFLDLFYYLTNDKKLVLNTSDLNKDLIKNKRAGYVEFTGKLTGTSLNGNTFSLTSSVEGNNLLEIKVESDQRAFIINESAQEIKCGNIIKKFPMFHQSELTNKVFEQLIEKDTCDLVTFETSVQHHLLLLESFDEFLDGREGAIT